LPKLIKHINDLIDFFEKNDMAIVRVLSAHKKDQSTWDLIMKRNNKPVLIEKTKPAKELDELKKSKKHKIITKTRYSAFIRTNLENYLRKNKIDTIVICGVMTNYCIGWTAIEAYQRDFNVILAKDAIFSHEKMESEVMLKTLRNEFEIVPVSNPTIKKCLKKN
jgi:nicotinamidase-related amidase